MDKTAVRVFNNDTDYYNTYTRVLISNKLMNTFKKKSLTFMSAPCANTHVITIRNNKQIRFYKTFNNTMYIGAAHADVTTTVVNVIIVSRTTHFLKYIP